MPDNSPIAVVGHNCWRRVQAERLAFLIDGQAYFHALKSALLQARHSVIILGWEFDSRTRLERGTDGDQPSSIGELLRQLVRWRCDLEIHLLIWDSALIYSLDREFIPVVKHDWLSHPRLHFRLDDGHPFGASHHQKVVVIDDRLAFIGGLDITGRRWDTPAHLPDDPRRNDTGFPNYAPFHDVQVAVTGEAARALGELARLRWFNLTGHRVKRPPADCPTLWPDDLVADIEDATVALARTAPAWEGHPATREIEQLFIDMISAARQSIYVENQYFTSRAVADGLQRRLGEAGCPEIAIITSGFSTGFLERTAMGTSRSRLHARLHALDHGDRLRLYAPSVGGRYIKVHAKLMIVDDRLLRIGSANLNNRSMGLDTECDLLVESAGDDRISEAIRRLRHRLLGEHLGRSADRVGTSVAKAGLHATIAALASPYRQLEEIRPSSPSRDFLPDTELFDPDTPVEAALLSAAQPSPSRRPPLLARFMTGIGLLAGLTVLAMICQWLPGAPLDPLLAAMASLRGQPLLPLLVLGAFLLAGLTGLPVFLLVVASSLLFGGWLGGCYAFLGIMASAAFSFSIGKALKTAAIRRLAGARASRISRALARNGIIAMAMLRIIPIASFTMVNLMAGAAGLGFGVFLIGTAIGLSPMVISFSVFGGRLAALLQQPSELNAGLLWALAVLLGLVATAVVSRMQRAAPVAADGPGHD